MSNTNYTLILDLDETLIHYPQIVQNSSDMDKKIILKRPGLKLFLEEVSKYYEIVIWTAGLKDVFFYYIIFLRNYICNNNFLKYANFIIN